VNTFVNVSFNNTPVLNGWTYVATMFTAPATGVYKIQYKARIQRVTGMTFSNFVMRISVGGVGVAGSQTTSDNVTTGTPMDQVGTAALVPVTSGQVVQIQWKTFDGSIRLTPQTFNGDTEPSVSVTIERIS
jgi:hypothetical protein